MHMFSSSFFLSAWEVSPYTIFWTSRGQRCHPFSPRVRGFIFFIAQRAFPLLADFRRMLSTQAVSYAVRFRASNLYLSISKVNDSAHALQICKIRPEKKNRFENPMAKIRRLGSSDFHIENGMLSKLKMLSTTANSSRRIDELDGDSCIATLLRARRVVGASLRGQTTVSWRGLGPRYQEGRTWRAPLRGYVLVDYTAVQQ